VPARNANAYLAKRYTCRKRTHDNAVEESYINDPNFDDPYLVSWVAFLVPPRSHAWSYDLSLQRSYFDPHIGNNHETRLQIIAASVFFLVLAGGLIARGILNLLTKANSPKGVGQLRSRDGATISQLGRPDGSQLRVECYGKEDVPPIILIHGWGANSTESDYLKKELSNQFRLIFWDLPGLGRSTRPNNCSAAPSDDLAVTADLVVQFDELSEWLCALIDQKQRLCRHRNMEGIGSRRPLPTTGLVSCYGTRHVGNASLRCNCGTQDINVPALIVTGDKDTV
jgi:hypothetical protein